MKCDLTMYHVSSPHRLPSHSSPYLLLPKPMCDKIYHFWIASNDHFTNKFICFQTKDFLMLHLNDHLYSKPCVFLWVANLWVFTADFASLPTLSRAFTVGHICITKNNRAFTRGGVYPYLLIPDTYFHFHV